MSADTTALDCPGCGSSFGPPLGTHERTAPTEGEAAVCITCGFVGVFHGQRFAAATPDERAALLRDDRVIDLLAMGRDLHLRREADADHLRAIVVANVPYMLTTFFPHVIDELVQRIIAAGFHTHRVR